MDLSGCNGCQDGVIVTRKMDKSGTNNIHRNYNTSAWDGMESGAKEYTLQTQKTEMNEKKGFALSFSGSAGKTAVDLSFHGNRNHGSRTIFDDADYFARNYLYKLMPITFETVNEQIIHIEHNYCNFGISVDASTDENLYKTISNDTDERNYKKRKSKSVEGSSDFEANEESPENSAMEGLLNNSRFGEEYSVSMQPLDLSVSVFHEQKADKMLKENQSNIPKIKTESRSTSDPKQYETGESNKENVTSTRKIEVTISRPDQKEYYQPCEVFLNDLARISPDLVKNDCYEIDIIDRTGQDFEREKYRTYYIVSESTWQIFENSTERIILTNDLNIGKPIQNKEKFEKPTYLIFDQNSLTESLVKICENKGGRFEYTCLRESRREVQDCASELAVHRIALEEESKTDMAKRNLTETNQKNLLCEKQNGQTEPGSLIISKIADEPKEQRIETEEMLCNNSAADAEEGDQTEPQVPNEFKPDDAIEEEIDKREHTHEAEKIEPQIQRATQGARKNGVVLSESKDTSAEVERKKRKLTDVKCKVDVQKRRTRSSTSLTELMTKNENYRNAKTKAVGLTKKEATQKSAVTKSKELKAADGEGKKRRRKQSDAEMGDNVRETRATAKRKAVENRRNTRGRKTENETQKRLPRIR